MNRSASCNISLDLCTICINNRSMEIRYIQEFADLAKTGSYSESAKNLHISQSSLSRHIQFMENELGESLFVRSTRKITLSAFGKNYLPYARKILEASRQADQAIADFKARANSTILLGSSYNAELYSITDCVVGFRKEHPEIFVNIIEKSLNELEQDFIEGKIHLTTMAYPRWHKTKHMYITAGSSTLAAVLPKDHFLCSYDVIPLYRFDGLDMMIPEENSLLNNFIRHVFTREGIYPNIVYQGGLKSRLRMCQEGMGIILEEEKIILDQLKDDSFTVKPFYPDISFDYGLQYSDNLSRAEKIFVSYVRNYFK